MESPNEPSGKVIPLNFDIQKPQAVLKKLDGIQLGAVQCLWQNYIPTRALTVIVGDPGVGKTSVAYSLVSQVSQGTLEGKLHGNPSVAVIVAAEDSPTDVIVPRLTALGYDADNVMLFNEVLLGTKSVAVKFPTHLEYLAEAVSGLRAEGKNVGLIYIDSFVSTLPHDVNANDYVGVTSVLKAINVWAETQSLSVVVTWHANKSKDGNLLNHILGSQGFGAAARAVLYVRRDENEEDESTTHGIVALIKANGMSTNVPGQKFLLKRYVYTAVVEGEEVDASTSYVQWLGGTGSSGDRYITSQISNQADSKKLNDAAKWLQKLLTENKEGLTFSEIDVEAKKAGYHGRSSLYRAKDAIGVETKTTSIARNGKPPINKSLWYLPYVNDADSDESENDDGGSGLLGIR